MAETLCQQDVTSRVPEQIRRRGEVIFQTGGTMVSGNSSRYSLTLPVAPFGRSSAFNIALGVSTENRSAAGIVRIQYVLPAAVVRTKMAKSRLELRKMHDAAEAAGISDNDSEETPKKKKKATRKKAATRKVREKAPERKRAVWVLYSGSMKEEGRYPYDQKEAAEERLAILQGRGKKLYFMQMVKELITGSGDGVQVIEPVLDEDDDDDVVIRKVSAPKDEDELGDVEVDDADFEDDDDDEEEGLDDDPDDD